MTTIDKLDISVYNLYAIRTRMIEQINQQLHLEEAASIPPQTQIVVVNPEASLQLSEVEMLLGILPLNTPWAYFFPPSKYRFLRRSPFAFSRVAPSLGSLDSKEALLEKIKHIICHTTTDEADKAALIACFEELDDINDMIRHIIGHVGQFLQG